MRELQRPIIEHTHPERRSWPWLLAAVVFCPCHIPILLAIIGTGALGGAIARNTGVLFVALGVGFVFALWRGLSRPKTAESCPACQAADRADPTIKRRSP